MASGAQPVLMTGAVPDRLDTTIDYIGGTALPAGTAWRWSGLLTAPANPGGTGWQLKVFVQNQANGELAVLLPWAGDVKAVLEMWYPGQEGGAATADVRFGRVNPGGRLPITGACERR